MGLIIIIILCGILVICLQRGKEKRRHMFSKDIAPYTKSQEEQFSFEASSQVNLRVLGSNIEVKQENCEEIVVHLMKQVGDKSDKFLVEDLDKITCRMQDNTLEIGFLDGQRRVNSTYIEAKVTVPKNVKSIQCDCQTGDLNIQGIYESININSKVGKVNLDLKKLDKSNHINIQGDNGDVKIKIPKKSMIKISGTQRDNVKVNNGVIVDENGASIQIDKGTSRIRIES